MHIALQGCLKGGTIDYGINADTGGHIRYLLELVEALARHPEVTRQVIVTRAFDDPQLGQQYAQAWQRLGPGVELWRCRGARDEYLPKEAMWTEVPALADALTSRIEREPGCPDLVHAHYADAGAVADIVRQRCAIPFVFTAHSLGHVKATTLATPPDAVLQRRIQIEQTVIDRADGFIISSNDELQRQYASYKGTHASRAFINAPGCDLGRFVSRDHERIAAFGRQMRRVLREPSRPPVLAIARPVVKKNLAGLVRSYGQSAQLRDRTNLVIVAGTRGAIGDEEAEPAGVLRELLELVDEYDLYGQVALPKSHCADDIPGIYQWAARRRGVFVNPAFNEPFGLTLLEAAAAGLPVVATRSGGPRDIIAQCGNGALVDPSDPLQLAAEISRLVVDGRHWERCSAAGIRNCADFTWERHAQQYVSDMHTLLRGEVPAMARPLAARRTRVACSPSRVGGVLACDLDGTLTGDVRAVRGLGRALGSQRELALVISTGRTPEAALALVARWQLPMPHYLVGSVGCELRTPGVDAGEDGLARQWQEYIGADWHRAAIEDALDSIETLVLQPAPTQRPCKLSYFAADPVPTLARVRERLADARLPAQVVLSHRRLLDVLPQRCSKGTALEFLADVHRVPTSRLIAAGDSGNDVSLLSAAGAAIVVANHTGELEGLRSHPNIYWARAPYAGGVLEGLDYHQGSEADAATPATETVSVA